MPLAVVSAVVRFTGPCTVLKAGSGEPDLQCGFYHRITYLSIFIFLLFLLAPGLACHSNRLDETIP
jgi:hypothetical protein